MFDKLISLSYGSLVHLGERFKAIRELRKLSLGQLAGLSGVSKGTISRLEAGKKIAETGFGKFEAMAAALRIPLSDIIDPNLWDNRSATFIVARAAQNQFFEHNQIGEKDRFLLSEALDKNIAVYFDPEGWKQGHELMKLSQRLGPSVADFSSKVADPPGSYVSDKETGAT